MKLALSRKTLKTATTSYRKKRTSGPIRKAGEKSSASDDTLVSNMDKDENVRREQESWDKAGFCHTVVEKKKRGESAKARAAGSRMDRTDKAPWVTQLREGNNQEPDYRERGTRTTRGTSKANDLRTDTLCQKKTPERSLRDCSPRDEKKSLATGRGKPIGCAAGKRRRRRTKNFPRAKVEPEKGRLKTEERGSNRGKDYNSSGKNGIKKARKGGGSRL